MPTADDILGKSLREHIGGRWAISLLAYVLNVPLNIIAISANVSDARVLTDPQSLAQLLGIGVAGYVMFGGVLLIANVTLFRNRRVSPVPVWWVISLGAIAGAARGVTVSWLALIAGFNEASVIPIRLVNGALLGAAFLPLAALILSIINTYVQRRRELLIERTAWAITRMRNEGASEQLRAIALADVESQVRDALSSGDPDQIRDISRKIWRPEPERDDQVRWGSVVRTAIMTNPYPTFVVTVLWAISGLGSLWITIGFVRATMQILFGVLAIALAFAIARHVSTRWTQWSLPTFLITLIFLIILTGPVSSALFDARPSTAGLGLVIANSMWLPALIVGTSIAVTGVRQGERVLAHLSQEVHDEEVHALAETQEEVRIRQEVAQALHGSVQSRLLAAAANSVSQHNFDSLFPEFPGVDAELSLDDRLNQTIQPWSALMSVVCEINVESSYSAVDAAIQRVVEEGLSNAYRHGNASAVSIRIEEGVDHVAISIRDNGRGVDTETESGLGSQILSTLGEWSLLTEGESGAELHAKILKKV